MRTLVRRVLTVRELNDDAEGGWCDWRKGKGISVEPVASMLRPFDVKSKQRQINNVRTRGYPFSDLKPVFEHYL